jgi:PAS domain S-box-containing protein
VSTGIEQGNGEREALLRLLAEQMPAIVWTVDASLHITSSLGGGLAALQLRPGMLVGKPLRDTLRTDDPEPYLEYHRRALRGEKVNYNTVYAGRPYEVWIEPLRDRQGQIVGAAAVAVDVTNQRQVEAALRDSEQKLRNLIRNVPGAVYRCGYAPGWTILFFSEAIQEITGYPASDFVEDSVRSFISIIEPEDWPGVERTATDAIARKHAFEVEYRVRCADGRVRWVHDSAQAIFDDSGKLLWIDGLIVDITERKQAEELLQNSHAELERRVEERALALRSSEAKFRALAETAAVATFIYQGEELVYANTGAEVITGYSRDELLRMRFWDVMDPQFQTIVRERGMARQEGEEVAPRGEMKLRTKSGETRWVDFTASRIEFQGKTAILGTAFDITERKKTEEALIDSESKHRAVLNAIPDSIVRFRLDGPLINFKPARSAAGASAYLGVSELAKQLVEYGRKAADSGETEIFEYQVQVNDSTRDYEARIVASSEQEAVAILRDVTDRKRMEQEILAISDHEKRRLGQDLHDGLCQHLTGTAFAAKLLEEKLAESSRIEARDAREVGNLIKQAITQARDLARGLYPVHLEVGGLAPAFEELARTIESLFRVSCRCDLDPTVSIRDRAVATHLYRIAQEAINNGIRHGKASRVRIALKRSNGQIRLTVRDNGVGLPKTPRTTKGIGLNIMRYRARMIRGNIEIKPARKGTIVTCSFDEPTPPPRRTVRRGKDKAA